MMILGDGNSRNEQYEEEGDRGSMNEQGFSIE